MSSGKRSRSSIPSTSESTVAQKVAKKPGRGIRLTSQTKYIIENVRRFFEEEKVAKRSTLINKRQSSRQDSQKSDGLLKTSVLIKYLYKILFI